MTLKIDLINDAYEEMRISGLTVSATPEDNVLALRRLEGLANELFKRNVCIGFNFEDTPDINSSSGIGPEYSYSIACILASRLLSAFGKSTGDKVDPLLLSNASAQLSFLHASTATPRQTQYPRRQSIGSGNSLRAFRFNRFYRKQPEAPNTCSTNRMVVGGIDDFIEHFDSWLIDPEEISSYTIEADTGLTIVSDSNETPDINYRIQAVGNNPTKSDSLLQVKIVVTSDNGRIEPRLIDFELIDLTDTP